MNRRAYYYLYYHRSLVLITGLLIYLEFIVKKGYSYSFVVDFLQLQKSDKLLFSKGKLFDDYITVL